MYQKALKPNYMNLVGNPGTVLRAHQTFITPSTIGRAECLDFIENMHSNYCPENAGILANRALPSGCAD